MSAHSARRIVRRTRGTRHGASVTKSPNRLTIEDSALLLTDHQAPIAMIDYAFAQIKAGVVAAPAALKNAVA